MAVKRNIQLINGEIWEILPIIKLKVDLKK